MQTLKAELGRSGDLMLWFEAWVYARQEEALWRALYFASSRLFVMRFKERQT